MCDNDPCSEGEARTHYIEGVKRFIRDVRESPIGEHARGVQREGLLLARSVFDFLASRIERKPDSDEPPPREPIQDAE